MPNIILDLWKVDDDDENTNTKLDLADFNEIYRYQWLTVTVHLLP